MSVRRIAWRRSDDAPEESLVDREWLVTNGLGGYASGTLAGVVTRRYHGLLVAALPNPLGRTMMLSQLFEEVDLPEGGVARLGAVETAAGLDLGGLTSLEEVRFVQGLPVWTFCAGPFRIERRVFFAHLQNTVYIAYRRLGGGPRLRLRLRPAVDMRMHDAPVGVRDGSAYRLLLLTGRHELAAGDRLPPLRMRLVAKRHRFVYEPARLPNVVFRTEAARGYEALGELWTPGPFEVELEADDEAVFVASTEAWETLEALPPAQAEAYELERRRRLIDLATGGREDPVTAELALAADQFLIGPAGRVADATRARAHGEELRTVIAGYHWFTDWGRDTMISLEGLTLTTGRRDEARWILHTFAHYVRDGLIPNLFPEGAQDGLYHTADATLWFFHAVDRYLEHTGDRATLRNLLPKLEEIIAWHRRGTRFGIRMDEGDGLLSQGSPHHPLTWMDAKCGDWIVTPRRGKAVDINALWFNALSLLGRWVSEERGAGEAAAILQLAGRVRDAFNQRFWAPERGYLYDVVDGETGVADAALRPNQLLAISLPNPVLARERWAPVVAAVERALLTPVGLRSLSADHPDFKPNYHGDLRTRDGAYHQGTVWSWLIGPYVDALLKVRPDARSEARATLTGLLDHLGEAGVGSVSEIFDAEAPWTARGCIAQAWGVAELLRAWRLTAGASG
jgi:predicted glycogen debranching enzyme